MAATIVSSAFVSDSPQIDGRFWVHESYVLDDGSTSGCSYLCDDTLDPAAIMATRVAQLNAAAVAAANAVPATVTSAQARRAINAAGLRSAVEAAVAASDLATQNLWYDADNINRDDPAIIALGAGLGLSPAQIDDLFRQASNL